MKNTVFFSWQSDRPSKEGRNLIERSLTIALARIAKDASVEEAIRGGIEVDKDTKNVPGSPPIFNTILKKIDQAAVFVPDLTFTGIRSSGKPTPNPNVLIEYGWALKTLSYSRIIPVMNEAYGKPMPESMPFDMAHLRFPITYNLVDGATDSDRRTEREQLAGRFEKALRGVFESDEFKASLPKPPEPPVFKQRKPAEGEARFRPSGAPIGLSWDLLPTQVKRDVVLHSGSAMWLRLIPTVDSGKIWSVAELRDHAMSGLAALPFVTTETQHVRAEDGFGIYCPDLTGKAGSLAFVFETGEIWSIDTFYMKMDERALYFGTIVEYYTQRVADYATFLQRLGLQPPYRWICGLEGVMDRELAIPPRGGFTNIHARPTCLTTTILEEGIFDPARTPKENLRPFFELICRKCSTKYPEYPPFG